MEKVTFENAKDNSLTCSVNGKFLHSRYRPLDEAEKYINSLNIEKEPACFVITEPCLCYTNIILRKKFTNAKICSLRYTHSFDQYDNHSDYVIYWDEKNISEKLCSCIGERNLLNTIFIQWTPAETTFQNESQKVWKEIKNAVDYSRSILFTNGYFSKKWFVNTVRNLTNPESFYSIKKITGPVVIAASGNSLRDSIPLLKRFREHFLLVSLSSATASLISNDIIPDLVLSTDGGYWAKKHLEPLLKKQIPIAIATEACCSSKLLSNSKIILLNYRDGFSNSLVKYLNLELCEAERNGTVSGTASDLFINNTEEPIFFCGLDLSPSPEFQHTQPNMIELYNSSNDNKLKTKEKRVSASGFNSSSLKIYEDWFKSDLRKYTGRVFRLSDNYEFANSLNTIKDVDFNYFEKKVIKYRNLNLEIEKIKEVPEIRKKIRDFIIENQNSKKWLTEFFPGETLALEKTADENERIKKINEISEKNKRFIHKLGKLIDAYL